MAEDVATLKKWLETLHEIMKKQKDEWQKGDEFAKQFLARMAPENFFRKKDIPLLESFISTAWRWGYQTALSEIYNEMKGKK